MPDSFFRLSKRDQAALLRLRANDLKKQAFIVEKDIWVCWALDKLFTMSGCLPMAFKGGTSLSKVYRVIDRFSEDIDVTLDYRGFGESLTGKESRTELNRLSDKLRGLALEHTRDNVKPYFESVIAEEFGPENCRVELDRAGEKLFVHYPSALAKPDEDYLASSVLLEFGGRNITEPNETHVVRPYIAEVVFDYTFPEATVPVLALPRTYWEKATLMHVECNRPDLHPSAHRLSRHWYDLYKLSKDIKQVQSAQAHELLIDVVKHKKSFFHTGYANYDDCLAGGLILVPDGELRKALEADFKAMVSAAMFYEDPPAFEEILHNLSQVQKLLNEAILRNNYSK